MQELDNFMHTYERANNSHNIEKVAPLIAENATYIFTDGTHKLKPAVLTAIEATFNKIQDEVYEITDIEWIAVTENIAVCTYKFSWSGVVNGVSKSGEGNGTNVLQKNGVSWRVVHEHLSSVAK